MGLRDNVVKSLRTLFDAEREDRIAAESPSAQAMRQSPNSIYNVWGREDVGGLLSVSQNLQDRYADCEAMLDYPDIRTAIEYFASDATQPNMDNGRTIWVKSRDAAIVGSADSLIKRRLRLEDDVYSMAFSLCSSGNCLEEVLITDNGVVGLNHLPAPTMRRVERLEGTLIGYVQDITGRFTAEQDELRKMIAGQAEVPPHVALFEDWQVVHFRLRTASRRSPYGVSVAEPARWIWKRLVMLEDAVMIYKLCLRGDSQIWTPTGRTAIKDLNEGDEVYSYTTQGALKKTRVVYKKHNGQDQIFRVFSDHRELFANKTHPVLVETIEHNGSGNQITRRLDYVEVQHLKPGIHRLVTPKKNDDDWEEIQLKKPALHSKSRLVGSAKRTVGLLKLQRSVGVQAHRIKAFFAGDYELKTDTAVALLEANGQSTDTLEVQKHWGGSRGRAVSGVSLPDVVDEDFARWWGFMLGDGFITTRTHKNGYEAQNEVGFAIGADAQVNETYRAIFERYAPVKLANNSGGRLGSYSFVSSKFVEFMLLNGFIPGCHEKRLPEWIYRAHPRLKLALIRGLADADAHITPSATSLVRRRKRFETARFELCNRPLLEDVRELAMQLGLVVTKIRSRQRRAHPINGRTVPSTTSYLMQVMFKPQESSEPLRGVESVSNDDIWDIGVEADEHNFVANGVTVHNTRAPQRYAFYVDTTDVPPAKRDAWLQKQKRDLKKKPMVDPRTGRLDMRYNPLSLDEDYVIAVAEGRSLARVEVLAGADYQNIDDVGYFQRKLHGALKVPRAYLGQDAPVQGRAILSNEDVRAARVTLQVQKELRNGIERLIRVDQAARLYPNPWQTEFEVCMTVPSGIYELAAMEVKNARADFASRVQPFVSMRWIREHVFKMSDEEIQAIEDQAKKEAMQSAELQQKQQALMSAPPIAADPMGQVPPDQQTGAPATPQPPAPAAPPVAPPSRTETIKRYDMQQRLEEQRDKLSRANHQMLVDKLGTLAENDKSLSIRLDESVGLVNDLRSMALRNGNGRVSALPSAQQRRF